MSAQKPKRMRRSYLTARVTNLCLMALLLTPSLAMATPATDWTSHYKMGKDYVEKGAYKEAIEEFKIAEEQCSKVAPESIDLANCIRKIAESLKNARRYAEAKREYQRVIALDQKLKDPKPWSEDLVKLAWILRGTEEFSEMETVAKRAVELSESIYGKNSPGLLEALTYHARSLKYQGKYTEAESVYLRALKIAESDKNITNNPDYPPLLTSVANLYVDLNRLDEAEPLDLKVFELEKKQYGANSPSLGTIYHNLGRLYIGLGDLDKADEYLTHAVELFEKDTSDFDPTNRCRGYLHAAQTMYRKDRFADAELYLKKATVVAQVLGDSNSEVGAIFEMLAKTQQMQGKLDEAEVSYKKAIAISERRSTQGTTDGNLLIRVGLLAHLYVDEKKYDLAQSLYERMASVLKNVGTQSAHDPNFVCAEQLCSHLPKYFVNESQNEISLEGQPTKSQHEFAKFVSTLEERKRNLGPSDLLVAETNIQMALWFARMSLNPDPNLNEAYRILLPFAEDVVKNESNASNNQPSVDKQIRRFGGRKQALKFIADSLLCCSALAERTTRDTMEQGGLLALTAASDPDISDPAWQSRKLQTIGAVLAAKNDWSDARQAQLHAMEFAEKTEDRELLFDSLLAIATLANRLRDRQDADKFAKRALIAGKGIVPENDVRIIECLGLLSGDSTVEASSLAAERLRLARTLRQSHPETLVSVLVSNAASAIVSSNFDAAEKLLDEADQIRNQLEAAQKEKIDSDFYLVKGQLYELKADSQKGQGVKSSSNRQLYEDARSNYRLSVDASFTHLLPKENQVNALKSAARVEHKLSNEGESVRLILQAAHAMVQLQFRTSKLSIGEQVALADMVREQQDVFLTIAEQQIQRRDSYFLVMMGLKGLLIDTLRTRARLKSLVASDPLAKEQLAELETLDEKLASLSSKKVDPNDDEYFRLVAKKEQLERSIERKHKEEDVENFNSYSDRLQQNEAFVDILKYLPFGQAPAKYCAFVLLSKQSKPIYIPLGEAGPIDAAVAKWRYGVTADNAELKGQRSMRDVKVSSAQPIVDNSKRLDSIYREANAEIVNKILSPIAEVLPASVDQLWLSLDPELARIPFNVIAATLPRTLLVSEVNNGREFVHLKKNANRHRGTKLLAAGGIAFNDPRVNPLPKTKIEVEEIASIAKAANITTMTLTADQATKRTVKAELPSVAYVHMATHGFARGEQSGADANRSSRGIDLGKIGQTKQNIADRNPLVDSGIFLSRPSGKGEILSDETGILTAEELVGTDLSNCQLVTLSACQTGLGHGLNGHGVLGLRAAIMGGGAKCVLMSLWKVDDDATQALMKEFYKNLWEKKLSPTKSLREAQNAVKTMPAWHEPKYWAGWVVGGDGF